MEQSDAMNAVVEAARVMGIPVEELTPWQTIGRLIGELSDIAERESWRPTTPDALIDDQEFIEQLRGEDFSRGMNLLNLAVEALPAEPQGHRHSGKIPEEVLPFRVASAGARFAAALAYAASTLESDPRAAAGALDEAAVEFEDYLGHAWQAMTAAVKVED